MSWLANFRILPKLLALIAFLSVVAISIVLLAIDSLEFLATSAREMRTSASEALTVARMNQNMLASNRAEYRMALDPEPDQVKGAQTRGEAEQRTFVERLAELRSLTAGDKLAQVDELEKLFRAYQSEYQKTLQVAGEARDLAISADVARIRHEAIASRDAVERVRELLISMGDDRNKEVAVGAHNAEELSKSVRMLLIGFAAAGVTVGAALGFLLANYGVARPISKVVAALQKLAAGETEVAIEGDNRRDEVGDVAKAAIVFKRNALEKLRMEEEQEAAKKQAEIEKRATLHKLADDFASAVGGIIETVSSAATELQASSQSMSATAEETSRQATVVAAASEQASVNVQTVASAAEQLASSVQEIGRQVAQSSQIADRAVGEADKTNVQVQALADSAEKIGDVVKLIIRHRGADQPAGAERDDRGGARRRGRQGLRRRRLRGQVAGQPDGAGDRRTSPIRSNRSRAPPANPSAPSPASARRSASMNEIAAGIAAAVEEQGAATQEIARNVQQASAGTSEVSGNIGGVSSAAAEAGAASVQVLNASQDLARHSETLRGEVGRFLATVRAA